MAQSRHFRGIPAMPAVALSDLPGSTRLYIRDVAAYQRQSIGSVETRRLRKSPLSPGWHRDERGWCYVTADELREIIADPPVRQNRSQGAAAAPRFSEARQP